MMDQDPGNLTVLTDSSSCTTFTLPWWHPAVMPAAGKNIRLHVHAHTNPANCHVHAGFVVLWKLWLQRDCLSEATPSVNESGSYYILFGTCHLSFPA